MAGPSGPSLLLKSPSLLALLFVQVSLLWQRLFEVGRAAALPLKLRILEAAQAARLAAIVALQDPSWLGDVASGGSAAGTTAPAAGPPGREAESLTTTGKPSSSGAGWWEQLPSKPTNYFSKNGEDGIILHLLRHVQHSLKNYVELGADGGKCSNTNMLKTMGWRGVRFNCCVQREHIGLYREQVYPHNVELIFAKYKVAKTVDLLTMDLDSNDAFVLKAIWKAGYRPRIVMVETNNNFGEESVLSFPPTYSFLTHQWTNCGQVCAFTDDKSQTKRVMCGSSLMGIVRLAETADYVPVYLNRLNLFLLRGDLVSKAMRRSWTLEHVLNHSRGWNRTKLEFPRKECNRFMDGLMPVVHTAPPPTTTTAKPAKPAAQAKPPAAPVAAAAKPGMPAATTARPPTTTAEPRWWLELPAEPRRVYSKGNEDGILEHIMNSVVLSNQQYVEFPSGDGSSCNTRLLRETRKWRGLLLDCCHSDPSIGLHKEDVTPQSVVSLFAKHKVPREVDVLSLAVEADDVHILRSIFQEGYRPRILVLKVNVNFGIHSTLSFPDKRTIGRKSSPCGPVCSFDGQKTAALCGAGVQGLFKLASSAAYRPAYISSGNFFFMVREDILTIPMILEWTLPRVLQHAKSRGWVNLSFPREACEPFMEGLVEVPSLGRKTEEKVNRWWERLPEKPRKIYSQNSEDGIIMHIFQNVKPANKQYFEFGSENGTETNTRFLRQLGWTGTNLDKDFQDPSISLYKEFVTPLNIVDLLVKYKVRRDVDILSIDVESYDLHVMRSVLEAGYRPRVIIVESNDNYGEDSTLTYPSHGVFRHSWHHKCGQLCTHVGSSGGMLTSLCGASVRGLVVVGASAGYRPLYLNKVNLFLVRGDTLPEEAAGNWTLQAVLKRSISLGRRKLVFPREECSHLRVGLVEAPPLPPSAEAIPLHKLLEAADAPAPPNGAAKAVAAQEPASEPPEGSVTAWLKAQAQAAAARAAAATATTTEPLASSEAGGNVGAVQPEAHAERASNATAAAGDEVSAAAEAAAGLGSAAEAPREADAGEGTAVGSVGEEAGRSEGAGDEAAVERQPQDRGSALDTSGEAVATTAVGAESVGAEPKGSEGAGDDAAGERPDSDRGSAAEPSGEENPTAAAGDESAAAEAGGDESVGSEAAAGEAGDAEPRAAVSDVGGERVGSDLAASDGAEAEAEAAASGTEVATGAEGEAGEGTGGEASGGEAARLGASSSEAGDGKGPADAAAGDDGATCEAPGAARCREGAEAASQDAPAESAGGRAVESEAGALEETAGTSTPGADAEGAAAGGAGAAASDLAGGAPPSAEGDAAAEGASSEAGISGAAGDGASTATVDATVGDVGEAAIADASGAPGEGASTAAADAVVGEAAGGEPPSSAGDASAESSGSGQAPAPLPPPDSPADVLEPSPPPEAASPEAPRKKGRRRRRRRRKAEGEGL